MSSHVHVFWTIYVNHVCIVEFVVSLVVVSLTLYVDVDRSDVPLLG